MVLGKSMDELLAYAAFLLKFGTTLKWDLCPEDSQLAGLVKFTAATHVFSLE